MKFMILLGALLASVFMVGGYLMAGRFEPEFGRTLFISGAVIFTGILISAAILEMDRKE